jgi:2-polyprenyl-3-methyl-5-hydroxy-6-metoxy-1,4-benzoquinol methylase
MVTVLRRCGNCALLFRTPTTTAEENEAFYQSTYKQGFTSEMPGTEELNRLLKNKFVGHEKDYAICVALLKSLGAKKGDRILDFGCSWGYGSWQLKQAGYEVEGFEISRPRCEYARTKLGLIAHKSLDDVGPNRSFDIFFSVHVLEHVPSIAETVAFARKKLKPGGLFVALTPNGSEGFRRKAPIAWGKLWGLVHPNFLDDVYYRLTFEKCVLASAPYDMIDIARQWTTGEAKATSLDGDELMVATRFS